MKRIATGLLFAVCLMCASPGIAQENPQLIFDRGNDALVAGDYRQAVNAYSQIENQDIVSGALFLNMGISYVQMDSLGKAKYYFIKASRFEETEEEANRGLDYVEQRFSRQSAVLPKLPWDKAVDWLKLNLGASNLLGIGIILLNIGVLAFVSTWFWVPYEKITRRSGLGASAAGLLIVFLSFYVQYVSQRYSDAVMVHRQTNVVEEPQEDAPVISQAYEGYTFTVDEFRSDEQEGWSYVRMSNGLYGWIPNNEIKVL
ncbi:SH3 domain-containing protein [Balneolaceae bacterium YR4-1]|uniref:SH3 domain-containing protein n=1 Tax=Halalkalibaculum roseum TaxID=2709311 RepID=A0A6M1SZE3_9BACT|nr:SH3 domain-containing protein [Halalkalibaculum roseum]NGP75235.1 SH3 domain-containing protein [Halalkalibaculum roseum]